MEGNVAEEAILLLETLYEKTDIIWIGEHDHTVISRETKLVKAVSHA